MSRTITKFAGVCALAMTFASGALAHGGAMAGTSIGSHTAFPSPVGSRVTTSARSPALGSSTVTVRAREPVTGSRIPASGSDTIRSRTRVPDAGTVTPVTGTGGVHVDPPPGNDR